MNVPEPTHLAFCDESSYNTGRFRSLSVLSMERDAAREFHHELNKILKCGSVREFKWQRLSSARERFVAINLLDSVFRWADRGELRLDTIIWDSQDSRHLVPHRHDVANLGRMYFHLLQDVLARRWPHEALWRIHPDEHGSLRWRTLRDCLCSKGTVTRIEGGSPLFALDSFIMSLRLRYRLDSVKPTPSHRTPLIQIADLMAGLAAFSWEKHAEYLEWSQKSSPKPSLYSEEARPLASFSKSVRERCPVLFQLDNKCKARRYQVALASTHGLESHAQHHRIRFWRYRPQHELDKAPTSAI